jgi:hypothetical protein
VAALVLLTAVATLFIAARDKLTGPDDQAMAEHDRDDADV